MPKLTEATPEQLRPFTSLGADLSWRDGDREAVGDCPFCGAERKFAVGVETSMWRCLVCAVGSDKTPAGGGNSTTFIRELHAASVDATALSGDFDELLEDRRLLSESTLKAWGVCRSVITGEWLVPGYDAAGKLMNLFRYTQDKTAGKRVLRSTSGMSVQAFGVGLLKPEHEEVWVLESWNALALWETLGIAKRKDVGVLGIPGCNVWQESWGRLVSGKRVVIAFDSDHPKANRTSGKITQPAYDAVKRTTAMLTASASPPSSVAYLAWGPDGYDPDLKNGWDARDALTESRSVSVRVKALESLFAMVEPVKDEWRGGSVGRNAHVAGVSGGSELSPKRCSEWSVVTGAWKKALKWRQELDDVLSIAVSVAASTSQVGDSQLFLQIIGDAGSGKTKMCDAMLVSKGCHALEHLTGFHSGWKGEGGKDCSLISRINHKTLITPEGDVMMSSPHFAEIMSQQRRIFDGSSGATYKNTDEDTRYTGLRTPWIMAGTPALLDSNQSRLGDRFLKVFINRPGKDEQREILRSAVYASMRSVVQTSNGDAASSMEAYLREAYQLTGGYIDHLRESMPDLINYPVDSMTDEQVDLCTYFGEFTAMLRARPASGRKDSLEAHDTAEMPTRLSAQFSRLAACCAVVLNKREIDYEVVRRVRKVALDTASGRTLNIAKHLMREEPDAYGAVSGGEYGRFRGDVALHAGMGEDACLSVLRFMKNVGIVDQVVFTTNNQKKWRLTENAAALWKKVML